eukprot:TRINITY_DN13662_c0_g1_i1.p1 TRINITY_DN13662_c0_g1~~TRINITY_DN13662_c0_g1_i1.p1  ORF type:complete len:386 (-),score=87.88 TRINITY_DN13662_c0_g1_i1:167-1324(-)
MDTSIDRLTRKMVNDCGLSVFRAASQGTKLGGNLALAIPELNWVLAAMSSISDHGTRRQLRHTLRHELVGPEILDQHVHAMYKSVSDALHARDQDQVTAGSAVWVPAGALDQEQGSNLKSSLRESFNMGLFSMGSAEERVDELNQWAQDCTEGEILRVVADADAVESASESQALITLTSHCKIRWETGFNTRLTWPSEFNDANGTPQLCQMMHKRGSFMYAETNEYRVVSFPTATRNMSVSFLLPHFGSIDERVENFTVEKWHEIQEIMEPTDLKVFVPRFKVDSSSHCLASDLGEVGIVDLTQDAGTGNIADECSDGMSVKSVLHRSVFVVDEEGGALPNDVNAFEISCISKGQDLRFDRPFLVGVHMNECLMQFVKVSSLSAN